MCFRQASLIEVSIIELGSEFIVTPHELGGFPGLVVLHEVPVRSPILSEVLVVVFDHQSFQKGPLSNLVFQRVEVYE